MDEGGGTVGVGRWWVCGIYNLSTGWEGERIRGGCCWPATLVAAHSRGRSASVLSRETGHADTWTRVSKSLIIIITPVSVHVHLSLFEITSLADS